MERTASQEGLRPSMLDRLIDPESGGTSWRRGYSVEQMIDAVRKDLEDLLNTHKMILDIPEEFAEVRRSIVAYGLPDPASYGTAGPGATERVCAAIEEAITTFEPRLTDVRAVPLKEGGTKALTMDFEIRATLRLDPSPEVAFVTLLKLTTGEATIQRVGR
ncbi:MAG: type VI secretion system baseplate subunit TssE [Isosphaeraceae bacterium]